MNEIDTNREFFISINDRISLTLLLGRALQLARANLSQARKGTQDTFMRYTACLDDENKARQELTALEERRDELSTWISIMRPYTCNE